MKDLKFLEVDMDEYNQFPEHYKDSGIKVKPFYTLAEKFTIYSDMKDNELSFHKDFALIVQTARFCTNIDFTDMTDEEIYNVCAERRLVDTFEIYVSEYMNMNKLIERDESVYKAFEFLIDTIGKKMETFDSTQIIAEVQKGLANGKDI